MAAKNQEAESEDVFTKKMEQTVMSGFVLAGVSLGVELGLFNAMSKAGGSIKSEELALKTKHKERYVREWLHHMVMCDIVDVDETGHEFTLPVHRHRALTAPGQMAYDMAPAIPHMLIPHQHILDLFPENGPRGVEFEKVMPVLKQFIGPKMNQTQVKCADMLQDCIPDMKAKLEAGIKVLDVGSGYGQLLLHLAEDFPNSKFVGVDLSTELLDAAKEDQKKRNITNVEFQKYNAADLPMTWHNTFDCVTLRDVLHDLPYPDKVLDCLYKCMKPGAILNIFDMDLHKNPRDSWSDPAKKNLGQMCYIVSIYHCLSVSMNHPGSIALGTGPGLERLTELITDAGFTVAVPPILADMFNAQLIFKK